MKISTATGTIMSLLPPEQALECLAKGGFTAIDYSLSLYTFDWTQPALQDHTSPEFFAYFRDFRRLAESFGLEIFQGHAPYAYSAINDFAFYERMKAPLLRSIYAAGEVGCPNMVVHPVVLEKFSNGQNRELAKQTILDYYGEFVPALKENGVTLCIENLFRTPPEKKGKHPVYGSYAEEIVEIVDTLNDLYGPHFAACLDTGHCIVVNGDLPQAVKTLGHRLRVLHIHDNDGIEDLHLPPGEGIIHWPDFMQALKQIQYSGVLNLECSPFFQRAAKKDASPEALLAASRQLYALGQSLLQFF